MVHRYVSGARALENKIMADDDKEARFMVGSYIPVSPGYYTAVDGLHNGVTNNGVTGICLLMDEADALLRNWVDFEEVRDYTQLLHRNWDKKLTKQEYALYNLIGIPELDANGNLCGPALGALGARVRSLFWVSATHMPTILVHVMWGLPFKVRCAFYICMSKCVCRSLNPTPSCSPTLPDSLPDSCLSAH